MTTLQAQTDPKTETEPNPFAVFMEWEIAVMLAEFPADDLPDKAGVYPINQNGTTAGKLFAGTVPEMEAKLFAIALLFSREGWEVSVKRGARHLRLSTTRKDDAGNVVFPVVTVKAEYRIILD